MARSTLRSNRGTAAGVVTDIQARTRPWVLELLLSLRPAQWTKNALLFAGLIFGGKLLQPDAVITAAEAFAVFCGLSGVVYIVNDLRDIDTDRRHPIKSRRPIASGAVSRAAAQGTAAILAFVALGAAFALHTGFGLIAATYLGLLVTYSLFLKHIVILDVLTIAAGFVMRAAAGAVVLDVEISDWLLVVTLLGALFLALGKRRGEMATLAGGGTDHRPILAHYSTDLLDQMITIVAASTLLAYAFYTINPETVARFNTDLLVFTLPFPLYGLFRYLYLIHLREGGANPSETLLTDRPILACVAIWACVTAVIIYGPWR